LFAKTSQPLEQAATVPWHVLQISKDISTKGPTRLLELLGCLANALQNQRIIQIKLSIRVALDGCNGIRGPRSVSWLWDIIGWFLALVVSGPAKEPTKHDLKTETEENNGSMLTVSMRVRKKDDTPRERAEKTVPILP
jgi:hypothetical protein